MVFSMNFPISFPIRWKNLCSSVYSTSRGYKLSIILCVQQRKVHVFSWNIEALRFDKQLTDLFKNVYLYIIIWKKKKYCITVSGTQITYVNLFCLFHLDGGSPSSYQLYYTFNNSPFILAPFKDTHYIELLIDSWKFLILL